MRITPGRLAALNALAAGAMLVAAYGFQYLAHLPPCTLCWYQRYAYMAVLITACVAWKFPLRPAGGLFAACYMAGAAIAVFHVGVEQDWWQWESACSGMVKATSIDSLRAELLGRAPVRCDEIAWSFLGLSMAAWNAILSICLMLLNLAYCCRR